MNGENENVEMLLAACLPGERTAEERARLNALLMDDAQARRTAEMYEKLAALLKGWRTMPARFDWSANAARVAVRVRSGGAEARPADALRLDELVPHWSGPVPEVDYRALKARISSAVRREARTIKTGSIGKIRSRRRVLAWIGRVGAPLAVAAAIVMAVWWPRDLGGPAVATNGASSSGGMVAKGPEQTPRQRAVLVSLDTPEAVGVVSFKFDEAKRDPKSSPEPQGWVGIAADRDEIASSDIVVDPFLY